MAEKILYVDDDADMLALYKKLCHQFAIETALSGEKGLKAVRTKGPYAVVVSDLHMPGMNGIQFLAAVQQHSPDSIRVMLTGQADVESAIAAVNEGNIFRFLTKPCSPETLGKALEAALAQHRLITAERVLLEKTLRGSVKVLTDVLSMVNPTAFGRAARLKGYVRHIAMQLRLPQIWQFELAAMLSQIGCVTLPPDTLGKIYAGQALSADEQKTFASHPTVGHNLLVHIPRLETIAGMIARQQEPCGDCSTAEDLRQQDMVSLGAQLLKIALDFDQLVTRGISHTRAATKLLKHPEIYDPRLVAALHHVDSGEAVMDVCLVSINDLHSGMVLNEDVMTKTGTLVIAKGYEVDYALLERLRSFARRVEVVEPFRVLVPRQRLKS